MTIRPESAPVRAASGMKISNASRGRPNPYGGAGIRAGSMPKGDRPIVLYPAYFDLGRTRDQGRRVAQRVLDARVVDRGPFNRDLDALRLLVHLIQRACDPVDPFEAR